MKLTKKQQSAIGSLLIFLLLVVYSFFTHGTDFSMFEEYLRATPSISQEHIKGNSIIASSEADLAQVTRVIDGDTIEINGNQTVRYIGIDTPETVDPRREVGCFGKEASDKNKDLVLNKTVTLKKDVSHTDRYGRLLRYVYVDGQMVNEVLVREGYAQASSYPPDVSHQDSFDKAERQAREEGKGLWGSCSYE